MSTLQDPLSASTANAQIDQKTDQTPVENPPWGILAAMLTWLASIGLLLLPQILAIPYVAFHYRGTSPTREMLLADKTLIIIFVSGLLPVHLVTLLLAWIVVTQFGRISARQALRWSPNGPVSVVQSVAIAIVLFAFAWVLTSVFRGQETDLERILTSSRAAALIVAFLAVATAPITEEVVYRGILYPAVQRLTGSAPAVIIVTLMFALPHVYQYWPNVAVLASITLLSLVLTVVRAYSRRLFPCFVIHLVFNGIQSVLIVASPYLRTLIESWQHKPTGGLLISVLRVFI